MLSCGLNFEVNFIETSFFLRWQHLANKKLLERLYTLFVLHDPKAKKYSKHVMGREVDCYNLQH